MKKVLIIFLVSWFVYVGWMIFTVDKYQAQADQNQAQIEVLEAELQEAKNQLARLQEECRAKTN